jgi:hypothetical protein
MSRLHCTYGALVPSGTGFPQVPSGYRRRKHPLNESARFPDLTPTVAWLSYGEVGDPPFVWHPMRPAQARLDRLPPMDSSGPTWIVMIRDVSHAVRVKGQSRVVASLILDADTGLTRGISVTPTVQEACAEAMHKALTTPAGPLPPQAPARVRCTDGQIATVVTELIRLRADEALPAVAEGPPVSEAEDIFDSFIGHLAGRRQPDEFPTPPDWQALFTQVGDYCRAGPWRRFSDVNYINLTVKIDNAATRYVAVVIGAQGIQRGLVLYPDDALLNGPPDPRGDEPEPMPAGTLLLWLDPSDEVPPEFAAKAARYGWPDGTDLLPVCLIGGPTGLADLDRRSTHHLTLAIAALLAYDRHRQDPGNGTTKTTGELTLPDNRRGTYSIN